MDVSRLRKKAAGAFLAAAIVLAGVGAYQGYRAYDAFLTDLRPWPLPTPSGRS
jgi:hypothetical protein